MIGKYMLINAIGLTIQNHPLWESCFRGWEDNKWWSSGAGFRGLDDDHTQLPQEVLSGVGFPISEDSRGVSVSFIWVGRRISEFRFHDRPITCNTSVLI